MKNKKNNRKEGKKAISPVISTIILIMIVIIIAVLILLWFKVFFKEIVLKEVDGNSMRAEDFCKDLQLSATSNPDGSFSVSNEGNIPVYGFVLKTSSFDGSSNTREMNLSVNPGVSSTITKENGDPELSTDYTNVELIPILLGKKKGDVLQTVTCSESYAVRI